jgi:hypothetical protein
MTKNLARKFLAPINVSATIILGAYTVLWGLWVANPFWTVFTQADIFNVLADIGGEYLWGILAIVMGTITVYGVIKPSYGNLTRGAFSMFFQWLTVGICYFLGDWQNTGGITGIMLAVYAAFIWLNLRVNRRRFGWTEKEANERLTATSLNEY